MSIFALKELKDYSGKLKIFKLLIDDVSAFDEFCNEIKKEGNLSSELRTIMARLTEIADLKSLPKEKFKDITPAKEPNKEYEIKTKHLRVYLFHDKKTGRVIVSGGKKTSQKSDIKKFRNTKKEYFKQQEK